MKNSKGYLFNAHHKNQTIPQQNKVVTVIPQTKEKSHNSTQEWMGRLKKKQENVTIII